jgi:hypothetical protein
MANKEITSIKGNRVSFVRQRNTFLILWLLTTASFVWFIYQGNHTFDSPVTIYVLIALLACTITLLRWLPSPVKDNSSEHVATRRIWLILIAVIVLGALFLSRTVIGSSLLFAWPVLAIFTLIYLKSEIHNREVMYALVLAVIAGITGLGAGWVPFPPVVWTILQLFMVFTGLIAGWALLRYTKLWEAGVGHSKFLDKGIIPALRSFLLGLIIAIPWALGIVLFGAAESQQWVQSWWQPFIAISAGIGEEVWGRVFPIPLLFLLLSRIIRPQRAYIFSLIIISYWFAYLHAPGGADGIISTVMMGTLYSLPLSYICLHRDLETAIGFHFLVDFVKFIAAFYLNAGIWLS